MYRLRIGTRTMAEKVLTGLFDIVKEYGEASIMDLKDMLDIDAGAHDNEIGWTNVNDAFVFKSEDVCMNTDSYDICLPDPIDLNKVEFSTGTQVDMINHPDHYKSETGLEAIDVIEAFTFDLKGIEAYNVGNIFKYMCRWKKKNGLQDLKKAQKYLTMLINHVEKLEEENKQV